MEQVHVKLENGVKELVVRQGAAQKPDERQPYSFSGNIWVPKHELMDRIRFIKDSMSQDQLDSEDLNDQIRQALIEHHGSSVLEVSVDDVQVCLKMITGRGWDTQESYEGKLLAEPILQELGINSGKAWSPRDLSGFIKKNRILFESRDQAMELVADLRDIKAKIERDLEDKSDDRGNKRKLDDLQVSTNIIESFVLNCLIFKGIGKRRFEVEVFLDVRGSEVNIFLESIELIEIQRAGVQDLLDSLHLDFGPYMPILQK